MSEKLLDHHGRWRSRTIGFRVSPEESELIDTQVAMSGLTKQDYITSRLLARDVIVIPNSRVQRAMAKEMSKIYLELRRIRSGSDIGPELEARMEVLADQFIALGIETNERSNVETEDLLIKELSRKKRNEKERGI